MKKKAFSFDEVSIRKISDCSRLNVVMGFLRTEKFDYSFAYSVTKVLGDVGSGLIRYIA